MLETQKFSLSSPIFGWVLERVNIFRGHQNEAFDHQRILFLKLGMFQTCIRGEGNQYPKWDSELIKFGEWHTQFG